MLNYEVDPKVLQKHLPPHTEIEFFEGKALVSVVGFLFNNTRVLGIPWPGFTHFEEVNLRYYIRHFDGKEWKRGVGFVSEIVPSALIAWLANTCYNEHYSKAQMKHAITVNDKLLQVQYQWKPAHQPWYQLSVTAQNVLTAIAPASEAEFILEHYYGYNGLNDHTAIEYQVMHPRWEVYPVTSFELDCDVARLYGQSFVPFIQHQQPHSVFLARGSEVSVKMPVKIRG